MGSASFLDGLALAATLKGDRGRAAEAGLSASLAAALAARVDEIRAADARGRQRALGAIALGLRPAIDPRCRLPVRAAAILAPEVPRETGAAWMARAPLPRPGFRASPALRGTLRRLATPPRDEELARGDRAAGREVLARALRAGAISRQRALEALGPADASAVLAAAPGASAAEPSATFARLVLQSAPSASTCEALGAMERGARGDASRERWVRAGREVAALLAHRAPARRANEERGCRG